MKPNIFTVPYTLSVIIAILTGIASAGGLFIKHLYRDNAFIHAAWQGNDVVTLTLVVPIMLLALRFTMQGSVRAHLLWLGSLGYMLYNYIFYLYGAAFNAFFLVYVAICALSVFTLTLALTRTDVAAIQALFQEQTPVKWIAGFMLFFAIPWSSLEVVRAVRFVVTGQVPADVVITGHPTAVVYATDLSLLMPVMITAAVWLWKRRAWGFVWSAIILFKGTTYGLALIMMSFFAKKATGAGDPLVPLYLFLCVGSLVAYYFLIVNVKAEANNRSNATPLNNRALIEKQAI
jgi:hypothetical protein